MMRRGGKLKLAAAALGVAGVAAGVAVGVGAGGDGAVAPEARQCAAAAALAHTGGGTVLEVEAGDGGAAYGVEVRRPDGRVVEVALDGRYGVAGEEADDDRTGEAEDGEDAEGEKAQGPPRFGDPTRIDNPWLPLSRHRVCVLRGEVDGVVERSVRRRLDRTEPFTVAGARVDALVIEDRSFEDGRLVERTLDYFAQADDGTVHYLGEDVDDIEDGRVVGHAGAWRLGRDTRTPGVAMPAGPEVGDTWRFEDVPGVTVEDDTVVTRFPFVELAGGAVHGPVIRVREDLSPEGVSELKYYARGVGEIRAVPWNLSGMVELVRCR